MSASISLSTLAIQNDAFRRGLPHEPALHGERVHTAGIEALGLEAILDIWRCVRTFEAFSEANDPYGEHDFGAFDHPLAGKVFWKIDYYDADLAFGSPDPQDPALTRRVLTVLLAEEY